MGKVCTDCASDKGLMERMPKAKKMKMARIAAMIKTKKK
jgi:hypothetical protein